MILPYLIRYFRGFLWDTESAQHEWCDITAVWGFRCQLDSAVSRCLLNAISRSMSLSELPLASVMARRSLVLTSFSWFCCFILPLCRMRHQPVTLCLLTPELEQTCVCSNTWGCGHVKTPVSACVLCVCESVSNGAESQGQVVMERSCSYSWLDQIKGQAEVGHTSSRF